jgi:hypothetical protein
VRSPSEARRLVGVHPFGGVRTFTTIAGRVVVVGRGCCGWCSGMDGRVVRGKWSVSVYSHSHTLSSAIAVQAAHTLGPFVFQPLRNQTLIVIGTWDHSTAMVIITTVTNAITISTGDWLIVIKTVGSPRFDSHHLTLSSDTLLQKGSPAVQGWKYTTLCSHTSYPPTLPSFPSFPPLWVRHGGDRRGGRAGRSFVWSRHPAASR